MSRSEPLRRTETPLLQDLLLATRYYLSGRRGLIILALALVVAGMTLNWSALVAAGVAPILLALAPCAAMCVLGLCMNKAVGKSRSTRREITGDRPRDPAHLIGQAAVSLNSDDVGQPPSLEDGKSNA